MKLKQNGGMMLIIGVVILLILGIASAFYFNKTGSLLSFNLPSASAPPLKENSPIESKIEGKEYFDQSKVISFKAPENWRVNSRIYAKGSNYKDDEGGYDIKAEKSDVELIDIAKGSDWIIKVTVKRDFVPNECGMVQGYTIDYQEELNKSVVIPFFGSTATRPKLEEGRFWAGGDQPEPFPQPIFVEGQPVKITDNKSNFYGKTLFSSAFCFEDTKIPVSVGVTYLSNTFTKENIEGKKLDYETIKEMDQILETFKIVR